MNNKKIVNLAYQNNHKDVADKKYVDEKTETIDLYSFLLEHVPRNLFSKTFIKEKVTWRYHTYHNILDYFIVITSVSLLPINQDWTNTQHKK